MRAGVVDINFGGSRALKFLPNGYTPVAEEIKKQMRAERDALDTKIEAMETQLRRGTEQLGVKKKHEATLLEINAKYEAATAASEASMKIIEERIDDLKKTVLQNDDPSGALYVLELLDKLDEAARGAGDAAAPSLGGASGSTGWRHASVEDYGRAMRIGLEELAESDRDERRRGREEHEKLLKDLARLRQQHDKRTADFHLESDLVVDRLKPKR